ncbi:hypothetical protein [Planktothricoides raciborskii]|uniref:Uncharacterized protein n=1 Tax=Planktothricoides raciborskii FACHB-1370 TaxID=2949576 RepID=A0ABR8EEE5_9CYAN|nr:hypothetical protein [Planktothricoides raciborskii]MBD2544110.1 hypothetical protein [Planktothricoides raciborskii FACHB-1370]MBD2582595.1 hypothetical protein [Planktothricoides raciborskii FACHB-1261]
MSKIVFSSVLNSVYYDDLEKLMFFNPQQEKVRNEVISAVERYGQPKIYRDGDRLRIGVGSFSMVQALFALNGQKADRQLLGMIAYMRENPDNMAILHIVVREDYSAVGIHGNEMLLMHLIDRVREIAAKIKGISCVTLAYKSEKITKIPVKHRMAESGITHEIGRV